MKFPLRKADCPRTAFVEASADLRLPALLRVESIPAIPAKPELKVAREDNSRTVRPPNRRLRPSTPSQKDIQSPQSTVRLSSMHSIHSAPAWALAQPRSIILPEHYG